MLESREKLLDTQTRKTTRDTFRHGNLPEALLEACLKRLEAEGLASISLREIAADVGVNHRAVYRHFPDKLALLARVAEEGWQRLEKEMRSRALAEAPGEARMMAISVGFFSFAQSNPNLFLLMAGPRLNQAGKFAELERAVASGLSTFLAPFIEAGLSEEDALQQSVIFSASLQGIVTQILHGRIRVNPEKAAKYVENASRVLFQGLAE